ncbi:MAG: membrane integrity-associated transporter subunit PqiC [Alphaproteobacteria bacterium]
MKKILLIAILTFITGCMSTPIAKTENYYTLQAVQSEPVSLKNISISLNSPDIPSYLNKSQVIIENANSSILQINEKERWIEPFGKLLERTITNDLYTYIPNATISNPAISLEKTDYNISIQINKLGGPLNGTLTLDAMYTIQNNKTKNTSQKRMILNEKCGSTYLDFTTTLSKLVNDMVKQIATIITK